MRAPPQITHQVIIDMYWKKMHNYMTLYFNRRHEPHRLDRTPFWNNRQTHPLKLLCQTLLLTVEVGKIFLCSDQSCILCCYCNCFDTVCTVWSYYTVSQENPLPKINVSLLLCNWISFAHWMLNVIVMVQLYWCYYFRQCI